MKPFRSPLGMAIASILLTAGPAAAVIVDPGFESGLTGWSVAGDVSVIDGSFGVTPTEGGFQVLLGNDAAGGALATNDPGSTALIAAADIQSIFDDYVKTNGSITGSGPTEGSVLQQSFNAAPGDTLFFDWMFLTNEDVRERNTTDFLWMRLELPDGSVVEDALRHAADRSNLFSTSATVYNLQTAFTTQTIALDQQGTYTLTVGLHDVEDTFTDSAGIFDNFRLVKGPEPGSFLLLGGGLLGLGWHGRYRRRAQALRRPTLSEA